MLLVGTVRSIIERLGWAKPSPESPKSYLQNLTLSWVYLMRDIKYDVQREGKM
jgi:hypothetical protein